MLKNYISVAFRLLRRHQAYSLINIVGLAVGLACCLLLVLYVQDELSYDRYHEHADHIYRVAYESPSGNKHARTPHPLAPTLAADFPEVQAAVRFRRSTTVLHRADQRYNEDAFYYTDAAVFEVFSFDLLQGHRATALADPFSVVLTEAMAQKYFAGQDPLGQVLPVEGVGTFTITGVVANTPANTHFTFDFLASYATLYATQGASLQAWDMFVTSTYLRLGEGQASALFEERLAPLAAAHLTGQDAEIRFFLDPLTDLHLYAHLPGDLGVGGDSRQLYVFASLALFILLISCINFMSLTTARSAERAQEVGIRKVLGAARHQLMRQFLSESILLTAVAILLALMLVELVLPSFNTLMGKAIPLSYGALRWMLLVGLGLGVGLLAGGYPALALSAFRPVQALKGQALPASSGFRLRRGLVVAQFGLSTLLIIGTLVMAEQFAYLQSKPLGFNKEQVVVIDLQDAAVRSQYGSLKETLSAHPHVLGAAASYHTPGRGLGAYYATVEDIEDGITVPTYIIDFDFIQMMEMEVLAGRAFAAAFPTDATGAFMVNEAAARQFGWDDPLGKTITWDGTKQGTVIGLVKDFHYQSLHQTIEPLLLHVDPSYFRRLAVRIRTTDVPATLAFLQATYEQFDPTHPFAYSFLDEDFARHYVAERRTAAVVNTAAFLAIFIACLGLLGLASFTARQRTKEIGVRKVLGATVVGVTLLLSKDFARHVLLGIILACPLAYYGAQRWLDTFAYRIDVSWPTFLIAGLTALGIAMLTVSYQTVRAALVDPVQTLRYE